MPGRKVFVIGVGMTKFEKPGRREDFDYPVTLSLFPLFSPFFLPFLPSFHPGKQPVLIPPPSLSH